MGSNGCGIIVHRLIDVRKKLMVTRSVPLGDLWLAGCWDRTGVDVIAAGFGLYCINVFVVSWMCKSFVSEYLLWCSQVSGRLYPGTCGSPLDNTLIVLACALCFGKNPQAVVYSAQPLCWSGWETSFPHHSQGNKQYGQMEPKYPEGGYCQSVLHPEGVINIPLYF